MGFFRRQNAKFSIPIKAGPGLLPVDRTVDRCRSRSTDVHKRARQLGLVGRSIGRSTIQRALLSGNGPGRPAGRPAESWCSLYPVPVDWRHNGHKNDRWPVDRAVDRKGISALSRLPTGRFLEGIKAPSLADFIKNFKSKIFFLSQCFSNKFPKSFWVIKIYLCLF